jgi:hypothetical protein
LPLGREWSVWMPRRKGGNLRTKASS